MINQNTFEAKIIKYLLDHHPVTLNDLRKNMGLQENTLYIRIKKLQDQGILLLEPAGDETYVTLLRRDFDFLQRKRQHKAIKKKSQKRKEKPLNKRINLYHAAN